MYAVTRPDSVNLACDAEIRLSKLETALVRLPHDPALLAVLEVAVSVTSQNQQLTYSIALISCSMLQA